MSTNRKRHEVRLDTYSQLCLTAIAVLMTVLIIGLWADRAPLASQAQAKGPFMESGTQTQLVAMVKAQQKTVAKLDQLLSVLKSGQVRVRIVNAGSAGAKGAKNASPPAGKR